MAEVAPGSLAARPLPPGAAAYGQGGQAEAPGRTCRLGPHGGAATRGQQRVAMWNQAACNSSNQNSSRSSPGFSVAAKPTRPLGNQHFGTRGAVSCATGRPAPGTWAVRVAQLWTPGPGTQAYPMLAPLRPSRRSTRRGGGWVQETLWLGQRFAAARSTWQSLPWSTVRPLNACGLLGDLCVRHPTLAPNAGISFLSPV